MKTINDRLCESTSVVRKSKLHAKPNSQRPLHKKLIYLSLFIFIIMLYMLATYDYQSEVFASDQSEIKQDFIVISVQKGESLWLLAGRYKPANASTRSFVKHIAEMNNVEGALLHEGQRLMIPVL